MKELQLFYTPKDAPLNMIIPVYQAAFAGEPWFEVSKCADTNTPKQCEGGFSKQTVGSCCGECGQKVSSPAYEKEELREKFTAIGETKNAVWYIEEGEEGITLASLAWTANIDTIAAEKYPENPTIRKWMQNTLGEESLIWLDEVFADKTKKQKGNLSSFATMCDGIFDALKADTIAYRTISPAMLRAPEKNFPERTVVYKRNSDVPDRRDFVVIKKGGVTI